MRYFYYVHVSAKAISRYSLLMFLGFITLIFNLLGLNAKYLVLTASTAELFLALKTLNHYVIGVVMASVVLFDDF